MPIQKSDFLKNYPFRVEFECNVFAPGEFVPHQPREFSYKPNPESDEGVELSEEEKQDLLQPRGETQKIKSITAIYYDAAQNPEEPEWVQLEDGDVALLLAAKRK